jgi:YidC/Oxa1 family membrane protein insertase
MKYIKNILVVFLIAMLLTSCQGEQNFTVPFDGHLTGGFEHGIFQGFIVYPIALLINFLTTHLGSAGIAMIITTVLVRSITLPVTMKAQLATRGMQELQPKMAAIEEKYRGRDDQQSKARKAQEMQKMYSELGVNPMSGMLYPMLSLPIFMGVWRATQAAVSITQEGTQFLGFNLGVTPSTEINQGHFQYIIIMLLVGISQFVQFKITNHLTTQRNKSNKSYRISPQQEKMQKQMGSMTYIFTAMMVFMSFNLKTAMSFYLIVSALISLVQAFYIDKKMKEDL